MLLKVAFILLCILTTGCREQIIHNLSEAEANRFLTRLHEVPIDARKERQADGSWLISVPESDSIPAIKFLDAARLLRQVRAASQDQPSIISTREDQRLRAERIISEEIEDTLASIRGVLEAHVHLNLPPSDPLFGSRLGGTPGSASVLLVVSSDFPSSKEEVSGLVAGASGIETKAISVVISSELQDGQGLGTPMSTRGIHEGGTFETADFSSWVQSEAKLPLFVGAVLVGCCCMLGFVLWCSRSQVKGAL